MSSLNSSNSSTSDPPAADELPEGTGRIGMILFLAALFMLFAASMVGYVLIRLAAASDSPAMSGGPPRAGIALGTLEFPKILWVSTVLIILASVTFHAAVRAVRINNQTMFRRLMVVTCLFSAGFVIVQVPALGWIIAEHWRLVTSQIALYGLVFVLILLHALHIIGGLIPLGIVTVNAHRGRYDATHNNAVVFTAMYWHFLDIVWLVMFGLMVGLR